MGLHLYSSLKLKIVKCYPQYKDPYKLRSNEKDISLVITDAGKADFFNYETQEFKTFSFPKIGPKDILNYFFDNNNLWITTTKKLYKITLNRIEYEIEAQYNDIDFNIGTLSYASSENGIFLLPTN